MAKIITTRVGYAVPEGTVEFSVLDGPRTKVVRIEVRENSRTAFANIPIDEWNDIVEFLRQHGDTDGLE